MRSSLKPIYLALGFVGACSLVNKFDPVNDVPKATGGTGGSGGRSDAGGEAGIGGSEAIAGTTSGGGTAGSSVVPEGGAAGETGSTGTPIPNGLVVVGTTVGTGVTAKHYVVLLDPTDGHEITRTATTLGVLAVAYEAARDLWFVFTGTPGTSGTDTTGPLLVGTMTSTGFNVEQMALLPKPTNQTTVAVLNQRLLYRSSAHSGASTVDDTLTLLDTSGATIPGGSVKAIGKLDILYKDSLVAAIGAPLTGSAAGGRVFFLHDNPDDNMDNCVLTDAGTEEACTVYSSSLSIAAADTNLTLSPASLTDIAQIDRDGSVPALGIQPSGNTAVIVVPPRRAIGVNASVFRYSASTGASLGAPIEFSLNGAGKTINPLSSITIPAVAVDPCNDLLFAGELANTALLYGVPIGSTAGTVVAFDPNTQNGTVGSLVYEPFTKTLISYTFDVNNPTFSGFQLGGTATVPTFTTRGKAGAASWKIPVGLVPAVVVVKNPVNPPCN
jgi:hypothetical protein